MARAIAGRLLHEPTLRMKRAAGSDDAYLQRQRSARPVRPRRRDRAQPPSADAERRPRCDARAASPPERRWRCGSPPGAARWRWRRPAGRRALGGAELVVIRRRRRARATSRASSAGSSGRCSRASADLGVHSAKDLPAAMPEGWPRRGAGARGAGRRLDRRGAVARAGRRGRPGRDRQPAPPLAAAGAAPGPARSSSCTATSTPGCAARRGRARRRSSSPPPGCAAWARGRDLFELPRRR